MTSEEDVLPFNETCPPLLVLSQTKQLPRKSRKHVLKTIDAHKSMLRLYFEEEAIPVHYVLLQ